MVLFVCPRPFPLEVGGFFFVNIDYWVKSWHIVGMEDLDIPGEEVFTPPKAPRKMTFAIGENYLEWLAQGHTQGYICKALGISRWTIQRWRKREPEWAAKEEAIKNIRLEAVEDSLFAQALDGNTTACIFWLKNRAPEKWRDVQRLEHDVEPVSLAEMVQKMEQNKALTVDEQFCNRN